MDDIAVSAGNRIVTVYRRSVSVLNSCGEWVRSWTFGYPEWHEYDTVLALSVGKVFVGFGPCVHVFRADGSRITTWWIGLHFSLALAANQTFAFVCDTSMDRVQAFSHEGTPSFALSVNHPLAVAATDEELFIAHKYGLCVYAACDGMFLRKLCELPDISTLAISSEGYLATAREFGARLPFRTMEYCWLCPGGTFFNSRVTPYSARRCLLAFVPGSTDLLIHFGNQHFYRAKIPGVVFGPADLQTCARA